MSYIPDHQSSIAYERVKKILSVRVIRKVSIRKSAFGFWMPLTALRCGQEMYSVSWGRRVSTQNKRHQRLIVSCPKDIGTDQKGCL